MHAPWIFEIPCQLASRIRIGSWYIQESGQTPSREGPYGGKLDLLFAVYYKYIVQIFTQRWTSNFCENVARGCG